MNTTPPEVESGFDPHKVRGIADVKRSSDDRMVAGVCSGVARYLNIDPVILRVILAALTFVGFAGAILYVAGWLLLPADNEDKSIAARLFKLDDNEKQFRVVGLIVAGVVAITAGTGSFGGNWDASFPLFALISLAAIYFWIIRPSQRRKERAAQTLTLPAPADGETPHQTIATQQLSAGPKTPWSPILTLVTLSTAVIAVGGVALYASAHDALPWTTYALATLSVIAIGLLVGTFWGNGGPLIVIGALVAAVLAASTLLPSPSIGDNLFEPTASSDVSTTYRLGIGRVDLDLTGIDDPSALLGRTVTVRRGAGLTRIIVPRDLDVAVDAYVRAGRIRIFDRENSGTVNRLDYRSDAQSHLTLRIIQSVGQIQVVHP